MALMLSLAACGDNLEPEPDAPPAPIDATAPDTPPDAACWAYEVVQCDNTLIQLCVPYHGCAFYTCGGDAYAYCGPQSGAGP